MNAAAANFSSISPALAALARRAFLAWEDARTRLEDVVVDPSVPILYFGDTEAYFSSSLRVLTVGLNPSLEEFPSHNPFKRFASFEGVDFSTLDDSLTETYLCGLNQYFKGRKEWKWFSSFEPILKGMGVSYFGAPVGTAIHTDLCSPVSTSPKWTGLKPVQQETLLKQGVDLWHGLTEALVPDVLVVSIREEYLALISFPGAHAGEWWFEVARISRKNPYVVKGRWFTLGDKKTLLAFGQAAQTPFGKIGNLDKEYIGRRIAEVVRA